MAKPESRTTAYSSMFRSGHDRMAHLHILLRLGWRNIWRNPRRTAVIMTAVVIGIWSMIFLGALMRGVADQMVRNGIATLTGHIQVHSHGYRSDPVVENSIADPEPVRKALQSVLSEEDRWTERVRVAAIVNTARHSAGVTLVGIDPLREAKVSFIGNAVTEGNYLEPGDELGILVGHALLEDFKSRLGHKLVVMSQDTDREIASRAFRIVGIFRADMEATEKQFVFVTITAAQEMLKLESGISEVSVRLKDRERTSGIVDAVKNDLPAYDVQSWKELLPMVTAVLELYDFFIFLWFLVAFIAMAFGIVNTMLMAVFERIREFGLLKSLGMKPWWIVEEVLAESFFVLFVAGFAGNALGLASALALAGPGIDLSAFAAGLEFAGMSRVIFPVVLVRDVILANVVVFFLGLAVSVYPAVKAARFTPVEALAHT